MMLSTPDSENVAESRPRQNATPGLDHPLISCVKVLKTKSLSFLVPPEARTAMYTMKRQMCKTPARVSMELSTLRNQRLHNKGTTIVPIIKRLVCHRSGT